MNRWTNRKENFDSQKLQFLEGDDRVREVFVVAAGMTVFGKHQQRGIRELGEEAVWKALLDAGIKPNQIEAAYCGYVLGSLCGQESVPGQLCLRQLGISRIPIVRMENACSSGSFAFKEAYISIASGLYDVVLAMGVEKLCGFDTAYTLNAMAGNSDYELEGELGLTFPGVFAMIANQHMHKYGTTLEQMASVSVKNNLHGSYNPLSQFGKILSTEEVLNSKMIADPITLLQCCPLSDGAAAVVLMSKEKAKSYTPEPIRVAATCQSSGTYAHDLDITRFEPTMISSKKAYDDAGLGPEEIDIAEVHDCFSIAEIMHYEDLGFCAKGDGGTFIESGAPYYSGTKPFNTSGGLLTKGHPIGATGIAQVVELITQLRNKAGSRQVKGAKTGLAHCLGGFMHGDVCSASVTILTK